MKKKKERREQPNQKTNPPMITSAKNYTKKTQRNKKNPQTDRTLGQMVEAKLYRQKHTEKHTHTCSSKEKKENIYIYVYIHI